PDIGAKAYCQGAGLEDLARNLTGMLKSNLTELATKLRKGDALCQRIGNLRRQPAGAASRNQPLAYARALAYARGAVPRGAFLGQPPAPVKAAPKISNAGADRINRVSKTMTQALQLATEATPFLKTAAQQELLQQIIRGVGKFFPTGFGILSAKGEAA